MQVADFVPNYPPIDTGFQQKIMNKTEFGEIGSTNTSSLQPPYFDFQVNIARVLSPYTPYKKCLFFLDVGVGKCVHPKTGILFPSGLSISIESMWNLYSYGIECDGHGEWALLHNDVYVRSYDTKSSSFIKKKVLKMYREPSPKILTRILTNRGVIIKTEIHKLFTPNGWISNIQYGDYVLMHDGTYEEVRGVYQIESDESYVYDLEIEDTHSYIADGYVTHNTCSAILVHEISKLYYEGGFRKTLVLTKGPSLQENWKARFIDTCPGALKNVSDNIQKDALKENFRFKTVGAFGTELSKMNDETIKSAFSNCIVVLDESHILKNYKSDTYKQYDRFFHLCENQTVIFMTGTPNTNLPWEGIVQLNLMKKEEEKIVPGPKFMSRYYNGDVIQNEEELLQYYHGYVTYVRQTTDLPPRTFMENSEFPDTFLQDTKIYKIKMSPFQSEIYKKSLKDVQKTFVREKTPKSKGFSIKEFKYRIVTDEKGDPVLGEDGQPKKEKIEYKSEEGGAFLRLALESSLFVYPDGTYGGTGYKKNVIKNGQLTIPPALMNEFKKDIGKYSIVYKTMFDIIEENPTRVIYIYFDNLNNSGLKLFAKLLEGIKGFTKFNGSCTKGKRYAIIDGSLKEREIDKILTAVGSKENRDASCIRVLLGSEVTQTGLTIGNATICIVANVQFTPSSTEQITQRINRPGSLQYLEEAGLPTDTSIYLLAPFAEDDEDESAYIQVYGIAEEKTRLIKPQEELMKRAGIFCPLNYARNVRSDDENYVCYSAIPTSKKGIYTYKRKVKDTKTDYLYFHDQKIEDLKEKLIDDIGNKGAINIRDYLTEPPMLVYRAAKVIASQRIILQKDNFDAMIFNKGDLFFIDPTISGDPNTEFYFRARLFQTTKTLRDVMDAKVYEDEFDAVETLLKSPTKEAFLKLSKSVQNIVFENAYLGRESSNSLKTISKFKPVYDIDGSIYNVVWAEPIAKDSQYGGAAIQIEDPSKIRILRDLPNIGEVWAWLSPEEYLEVLPKIKVEGKKSKIVEIEGDLYGLKSRSDDIFKVYIKGGNKGGRACKTLNGQMRMEIYRQLGLFGKYKKEIQKFKKDHPNVEEKILEDLKKTKFKSIPEKFSVDDKIGAYFALKEDDDKCAVIEKALKEKGLYHEFD